VSPTAADPAGEPPVSPTEVELPARLNRVGGDVEVAVSRDGDRVSLRGTWRRVGLRALWTVPLLAVEVAVLGGLWWQLPFLRPLVVLLGALLAARHLLRGGRELRGILRGWLTIDTEGIRGAALTTALPWSQVREIRLWGDPASPTVGYIPSVMATSEGRRPAGPRARRSPRVTPDLVPTEQLLEVLVPEGVPLALGAVDDDPLDVEVVEEGFHVRPARGRAVSMRWEALVAVEVTARPAGSGRLARSLEVLGEVRLPGASRARDELLSLPITLAGSSGLLDALRRVDTVLPERAAASPAGTHELWTR
jgi:hypothetical protein